MTQPRSLSDLPKLSLAMIVRDCAPELKVCLDSVKDHVDEIVIVDTGSIDDTKTVARCYTDRIFDFTWIDDFAAARQFSFDQCTNDLVLWLDSDDELISGHQVCEDAKIAHAVGMHMIMVRYDYMFDRNYKCRTRQMRERFVDRTVHQWRSPIHECLCSTFKTNVGYLPANLGYVKHRRGELPNRESSEDRNLRIMEALDKQGKLETRTHFYYGNALRGAQRYQEALEHYMYYIPRSGVLNERYVAMIYAALCEGAIGQPERAKKLLGTALLNHPNWPSAYLQMAEFFMQDEDHVKAEEWANEAITHQMGLDNETFVDPARIMGRPYMIKSVCDMNRGKLKEAAQWIAKAEEHLGDDPDIIKIKDAIVGLESTDITMRAFVTIANELISEDRQKDAEILATVAPESIKLGAPVRKLLPRQRRTSKPLVSIVCPTKWEYWGPSSIDTGIGGSEEAVIHMSQELKKYDLEVEVYAHTKEEGEHDGVQWFPTYMFDGNTDVAIYWRAPHGPIDSGLNAKISYLWLHDVPERLGWVKEFPELFDRVFVLSDFHRKLYEFVPDELAYKTRNGIDLSRLPDPQPIVPQSMIYASCPSRGLIHLLKWWRYIRDQVPQATLDCYYGWNNAALTHKKVNAWLERCYQDVERLKTQQGVRWHGRVGQPELHDAFARTQIWAYPTMFDEISCITAMKAQALGCMPIVNAHGAVQETVQYGFKFPDVDMEKVENQKKFADTLIQNLKDPSLFKDREVMVQWSRQNHSWETLAHEWAALIKQDLERAGPSKARVITRGKCPRPSLVPSI